MSVLASLTMSSPLLDPTSSDCPKSSDSCKLDGVLYSPALSRAPECWSKSGSGWTCFFKSGSCGGAKDATITIGRFVNKGLY
ncbi:hypothetical protein K502DRAFT_365209 [Neoconidiobolus thromboides FSU 785]|nr:hypothetical protein K502DRAFT_365209 [Neoconidiobolus thromboides FSU 785]